MLFSALQHSMPRAQRRFGCPQATAVIARTQLMYGIEYMVPWQQSTLS